MSSLFFFCGHAGAGKTTLAKRVLSTYLNEQRSFCFLDKDTLYGNYSAEVMGVLTGDPDDRDSPLYLKHLRDPEYRGVLDTARENIALGVNAIVVGPLSQEVRNHILMDANWLNVSSDTQVKVVWVHVQEAEAHRRIIARNDARDAYKLAHWHDYRTRLFMPTAVAYPELIFYDNTAPTEAQFSQLLGTLRGGLEGVENDVL